MEMSPNTLPWSLWLLLVLTPVTRATGPPETPLPANATLLFDGGAPGYAVRNCSCPSPVRDCDEALANSVCRCHSVPRSALPPAGLREAGLLTVWVKEVWLLEELLNRSAVGHLRLSFCGETAMGSEYLALLGLRTLAIHSAAPEAPYPDQQITVAPPPAELEPRPFHASSHVTFLDVALLNGRSALKAYTVVGPPAHTVSQHFPHLVWPRPPAAADPGEAAADPRHNLLLTFVY